MKQLSQIIALNLFGLTALQIIIAIGSAIILLQMMVNKFFSGAQMRWEMRKKNKEIESNMWAIE